MKTPQDDVAATTSATPPLEVVRLFCGLPMSMPGGGATNSWMSREHTVTVKCSETTCPSKLRRNFARSQSQCLRLKRCWYGTRDAGQGFKIAVRDLEVNNFSQRAHSPCVYRHKTRRLWHFVHGGDWSRGGASQLDTWDLQHTTAHPEPCARVEIITSSTC